MIPLYNLKRFFWKALRQPGYALSVGLKRIQAYGYYLFGKGVSAPAESVTFFLTHRCNLHCKMCGQWGESGVTRKEGSLLLKNELSFESLVSIIDDLARFKPGITLFGGEPLMHPAVIPLIRYIKQKKMHALMITNGSLLKKFVPEIIESGLDELNVSIDGPAEVHNEIRGLPGLYESIMSGLHQLKEQKRGKNLKKPLVNLQCTVTKYNYQSLEKMIDVALDAGADSLTFHNLIFLEPMALEKQKEIDCLLECSSSAWEGFLFPSGMDPEVLHAKVKGITSKRYPFTVDFYPNFSRAELGEYYGNPQYQPLKGKGRCISPWIAGYVFPDGELRPCLNCSFSFGNILQESFSAAWNSLQAQRYRQELKNRRMFPACIRCTELYRY